VQIKKGRKNSLVSYALCACPHEITRELLNGFSWNLIISFTNICRHIPILVKIGQQRVLHMETYMRLFSWKWGWGIPPEKFHVGNLQPGKMFYLCHLPCLFWPAVLQTWKGYSKWVLLKRRSLPLRLPHCLWRSLILDTDNLYCWQVNHTTKIVQQVK
jgi:hypothetical protein